MVGAWDEFGAAPLRWSSPRGEVMSVVDADADLAQIGASTTN